MPAREALGSSANVQDRGQTERTHEPVLEVRGLEIAFESKEGLLHAVHGIDLEVGAGEVVALVGESGSGKTVSALALLGLLPHTARVRMDYGTLARYDLSRLDKQTLKEIRGARVGIIFQDPLSSLNPVQKVGHQIKEAVTLQRGLRGSGAKQAAIDLLTQVGIPNPAARYDDYPHQFSGGMRQRAMIAIALAGSPPLLVADEPTTALDVTVQAQILELIARLQAERGMGVLMITHDLGVVAGIADRILVMYAGRIVETGPAEQLLRQPRHRYTLGLLRSLPRLDARRGTQLRAIEGGPPDLDAVPEGCAFAPRCEAASEQCAIRPVLVPENGQRAYACWHPFSGEPISEEVIVGGAGVSSHEPQRVLEVSKLQVVYDNRRTFHGRSQRSVKAVDGVDLGLGAGTTLGLVGESGSGKTTLGRAIVRLLEPSDGSIIVHGRDIATLGERELRPLRCDFQIVFQDPQASLNPRQRVQEILASPLEVHGLYPDPQARRRRISDLLELVGLSPRFASRLPHELSGGQRQRVGIARALAVEPKLLVLDEAVSALDVSVRAQILNLLERLQAELGVAYVFIAHDLAVVRHIAAEVAVMYVGRIVERGPSDEIYTAPRHPYTAALLSAVPIPDVVRERRRERILLPGDPADPRDPPSGCPFHTRCWLRERLGNPERCVTEQPALSWQDGESRRAACHYSSELRNQIPLGALVGGGWRSEA
jgi:peptide/nickel transport system ATP-binding protein